MKNHVWTLVRQQDTANQCISSWTGFNILTRDKIVITQDKIRYLPTINATATELSTVHEVLRHCLEICNQLNLEATTYVFDQALYTKAAKIVWKKDEFKPIIIRMGVFHTICNMMSIIGKRFKDAALRDLAVESEVITEGSIDGVLYGRKYNRAVRFHKLLYEALHRLVWKQVLSNDIHTIHKIIIFMWKY